MPDTNPFIVAATENNYSGILTNGFSPGLKFTRKCERGEHAFKNMLTCCKRCCGVAFPYTSSRHFFALVSDGGYIMEKVSFLVSTTQACLSTHAQRHMLRPPVKNPIGSLMIPGTGISPWTISLLYTASALRPSKISFPMKFERLGYETPSQANLWNEGPGFCYRVH